MTIGAPPRGLVGQSIVRREDVRFLTGSATYVDDVVVPGALHAAFVRSPHPHALLGAIDASAARAMPGVVRVLTSADLPGAVLPLPRVFPHTTIAPVAHPVFASERVRYVGQVVAAVVAESRAIAEDAADRVEVAYEPLDAVVDPRAAAAASVRLHAELPDNVFIRYARQSGDVEAAFARAAHVVRRAIRAPRVAIAPLETRGTVASYDAGTDLLTVWCSAQDPHRHRMHLARTLGRPEDRIRLIVPDVGGGFGQKSYPQSEVTIVAHAAVALRRPVRWTEDRRENLLAAHHGRGLDADAELALDADGRFLALRAQLIADCGAYLYSSSPNNGVTAASLLSGVYDIPAAHVTVAGVATNKVPTSPYRGAGRPEAALVIEALVDLAARTLRIDPLELRRRNLVRNFPYATATGTSYDSGDYEGLLDKLAALADLPRLREDAALARLEGRLFGVGVGLYVERSGGGWERAAASIEPGGRVIARIGSTPHGQGHETTFAQVLADVLAVPLEDIVVRWGDSSEVPRGMGTFASRSMTMGGNALRVAGEKLRAKAAALAAHLLGATPAELAFENGVVAVAADPARRISFAELAAASMDPAKLPPGADMGLEAQGHFASDYGHAAGAHLAVVEVDRATGKPAIRRLVAVDDAGTIVNPLLAEGQVVGAAAQGIGEALFEEAAHDEYGRPLAASFLDYPLVTAGEMPPVTTAFQETPSPLNPLGIKGVGEGGACGAPCAVANAIADALAPLRAEPLDLPFTAEKLWRAIRAAENAG